MPFLSKAEFKHEIVFNTKISKVRSLYVTWLFLEGGGAPTGEGVHVSRDGTNGHMTGPSNFLASMLVFSAV